MQFVATVYEDKGAFSALTLLVGRQEGHRPVNWVVGYWTEVQWFAYGPANVTATHPSSLALLKSTAVYLSGAGLPSLSWKKAVKQM